MGQAHNLKLEKYSCTEDKGDTPCGNYVLASLSTLKGTHQTGPDLKVGTHSNTQINPETGALQFGTVCWLLVNIPSTNSTHCFV
jgi:hypothetical protein